MTDVSRVIHENERVDSSCGRWKYLNVVLDTRVFRKNTICFTLASWEQKSKSWICNTKTTYQFVLTSALCGLNIVPLNLKKYIFPLGSFCCENVAMLYKLVSIGNEIVLVLDAKNTEKIILLLQRIHYFCVGNITLVLLELNRKVMFFYFLW